VCAQLVQVVELEQLEAEPIVADPQPGRVRLAAGTAPVENPGTSFVLTVVESASCR